MADLTRVIYNYQVPGENGNESNRITEDEEMKINRSFVDTDCYAEI